MSHAGRGGRKPSKIEGQKDGRGPRTSLLEGGEAQPFPAARKRRPARKGGARRAFPPLTGARPRPYEARRAQVAELVDALVSGTSGASREGSSPFLGTISPNNAIAVN